jgi:hypothetical protein
VIQDVSKDLGSFKMSGIIHQMTPHHIPDDLNPQHHHHEYTNSHGKFKLIEKCPETKYNSALSEKC